MKLFKNSKIVLFFLFTLTAGCQLTTKSQVNQQRFQLSKGLDIKIDVPNDYAIAADFLGFENRSTLSKITFEEIASPLPTIKETLTREVFEKIQLEYINEEEVNVDNIKAKLITLKQAINGVYFEKLWLITGDNLSTVRVTASYPESQKATIGEKLRASLLSTQLLLKIENRIFSGLPFELTTTLTYEITKRATNSIVLKDSNIDSTVVISHGKIDNKNKDDIEGLAQFFIDSTRSLSNVEILKRDSINIANLPAIRIQAYAKQNNNDLWFCQLLITHNEKFALIHTTSKKDNKEVAEKSLYKLLESLRFKAI